MHSTFLNKIIVVLINDYMNDFHYGTLIFHYYTTNIFNPTDTFSKNI